jgi:hypothetical protein
MKVTLVPQMRVDFEVGLKMGKTAKTRIEIGSGVRLELDPAHIGL